MNAEKLARALRLAAEALEETQGTPIAAPKPPASKTRRRRLPDAPAAPVSEAAAERARRALEQQGFMRRG